MSEYYHYPKVRGDEYCRFCKHQAFFHMTTQNFGAPNMSAVWKQCDFAARKCSCPGFGAIDNLLYLEMCADDKRSSL